MTDSPWSADEFARVGQATELQIASRRADGALRCYVTIWVVGVGGDLYVRSAYGADNPWFRRARASGTGRVRAGGVERDVRFDDTVPASAQVEIDAAYHEKYDRFGPDIVGTVVGEHAHPLTLRLVPADA